VDAVAVDELAPRSRGPQGDDEARRGVRAPPAARAERLPRGLATGLAAQVLAGVGVFEARLSLPPSTHTRHLLSTVRFQEPREGSTPEASHTKITWLAQRARCTTNSAAFRIRRFAGRSSKCTPRGRSLSTAQAFQRPRVVVRQGLRECGLPRTPALEATAAVAKGRRG
jgi:hypothetical protein